LIAAVDAEPGRPRHLIRLQGDVDLASAATIRELLTTAIGADDGDLVVDMSKVTFMGATGLNILVSVRNRLDDSGRRLIVKSPSPSVRRILGICQMDQILAIEDE
jgi:anti-sigma B factor antagonist